MAHAALAEKMGVNPKNILVCEDGDRVELTSNGKNTLAGKAAMGDRSRDNRSGKDGKSGTHSIAKKGSVPAGYVYVHGTLADIGRGLLEDRRILGREGVVVIIATVDLERRRITGGPEVVSKGWVYEPEAGDLLDDAADIAFDSLKASLEKDVKDPHDLEQAMRRAVGKLVSDRTARRPMLMPLVTVSRN